MPEDGDQQGIALTITGKDIWDKLVGIEQAVHGLPHTVQDHENRLRILERKVWMATGIGATLGGSVGAALFKVMGGA